jgi:hypothetical protein
LSASYGDTQGVALVLMDFHAAVVAWHGDAGLRAVDAASIALAHARMRRYAVFHVAPAHRANRGRVIHFLPTIANDPEF